MMPKGQSYNHLHLGVQKRQLEQSHRFESLDCPSLSKRELKKKRKKTVVKMLHEVRKATQKQNENFNKEIENIKRYHTEITKLKNTITELQISV